MSRSLFTRLGLAAAGAVALASLLVGCSSSDSKSAEAKYCDSWQEVANSFQSLNSLDLSSGLTGIQTAAKKIQSSMTELVASANSMLKPETEALKTSINKLVDTLSAGEPSIDSLNNATAALKDVDTSWNALVAKAKTECPDVQAIQA